MTQIDSFSFRVITTDDHGQSVRCSYCTRGAQGVPCVVALPLPDTDAWIGVCAYCVLAMARALAQNNNEAAP